MWSFITGKSPKNTYKPAWVENKQPCLRDKNLDYGLTCLAQYLRTRRLQLELSKKWRIPCSYTPRKRHITWWRLLNPAGKREPTHRCQTSCFKSMSDTTEYESSSASQGICPEVLRLCTQRPLPESRATGANCLLRLLRATLHRPEYHHLTITSL